MKHGCPKSIRRPDQNLFDPALSIINYISQISQLTYNFLYTQSQLTQSSSLWSSANFSLTLVTPAVAIEISCATLSCPNIF